jgi:hypothetical protein
MEHSDALWNDSTECGINYLYPAVSIRRRCAMSEDERIVAENEIEKELTKKEKEKNDSD